MTSYRAGLPLVIGLYGFALFASPAHAQVYPSAGTLWVTGDTPEAPTDPQTIQDGLVTSEDVVRWQATHADYSAWGGLNYRRYVPGMVVVDYILTGFQMGYGYYALEQPLCEAAIKNGHHYEDFYLHYQTDTWMNVPELYQNLVPWAGVPAAVGYTSSLNDQNGVLLPGTGPWSADIFQGAGQGGAFYLADPEKFAEATLTFAPGGANGTVTIEYASAVDDQFNVTGWTPLELISDGTLNFSRNGTLKWIPPADWDWVWGVNSTPQGVHFPFAHWLRIKGTGFTQRPILTGLQTRAWLGVVPSGFQKRFVKIPGWDPRNDVNGDGYVDDQEYAQRLVPGSTARFRYESRVAIVNLYFDPAWAISMTNTANPQYQQDIAQIYHDYFKAKGFNGGYQDCLFYDLNSWFFPIIAGGQLLQEGSIQGTIPTDSTNLAYSTGLVATLSGVKRALGTHWMGTNTGYINPYDWHAWTSPYPDTGRLILNSGVWDWVLLEATPYDSWSMVDAVSNLWTDGGLSRLWHIAAYARAGVKSALMERVGWNLVTYPTTQSIFERSQMGLLAEYYLYHFPGLTALQTISYNNPDLNTNTTTSNYYKAGVPPNYAYQPHKMLAVDIGTPTGVIPPGYAAMQYTAAVDGTGQRNNTIIGLSSDTVLNHPVYGPIPVSPTADYYLLARPTAPYTRIVYDPYGHAFPAEVVLARTFTKGLVVFRTSFSRPLNEDYSGYSSDGNQITVTLPGIYQRVNFDGTLAPPSNQVVLHGFEGAVFVTPAPVITSPLVVAGFVGRLFGYQITATNNPTSFGASGLPLGLRVNTTTGLISGIPGASGTFNVGLSATNQYGTGTATLQMNIRQIGPGRADP